MVAPPCFGLFLEKEWRLLPVALKFLKLTSYQAVSYTGFAPPEAAGDALSQDSGDDGERDHRTAGFELQRRQEAFSGGIIIALSLQHLSQAVPDLVGCGVHLDSISENLLCQAIAPKLMEYQSLQENKGKMAEIGQ